MKKSEDSKDRSHRLGLFALFLICGLLIQPIGSVFLEGVVKIAYLIALPIIFFLSALILHRNENLKKYFPVFFAFFVCSFVTLLNITYTSGSMVEEKVFNLFLSTLVIVIPIVLLTKVSGNDMASIYLKKGNLRLGLIIGVATFLVFLLTSVPAAIYIFGGKPVTSEQLISWAPWIATFVFLNGLREELWFRGLFLKKYEKLLGVDPSNLLQAVIFSLAHTSLPFTPFLLVYWVLTFFLGLGFGATMQKTDSVLGSILFHAGTDIPVIIAVFSLL